MRVIWTAWIFICAKFFFPHYYKHLAKFIQHPEKKKHAYLLSFVLLVFMLCCKYTWSKTPLKLYSVMEKCWFDAMIRVVSDFSGSLQQLKKQMEICVIHSKTKTANINIFYRIISFLSSPPKNQNCFLSSFRRCSLGVFSPWTSISNQICLL